MHSEHSRGFPQAGNSLGRGEISRQDFLKLGGAGLASAALLGSLWPDGVVAARPLGRPGASLAAEFERAAQEYGVPAELLAAMGYVNTRWVMPPPNANVYKKGDIHGWGSYGIMALAQNPFSDTLGEASRLTGIPEGRLKADRAANILGGAALLAKSIGDRDPSGLEGFYGAIAGNGRAPGKDYSAVTGVGGGELYAEQVFETLEEGVPAVRLPSGEEMSLAPQETSSGYEFTSHNKPYTVRRRAHPSNYTNASRGPKKIDKVVIHMTQGSWSGAIRWFRDPRADVSAHYVIRSRDGRRAQCVPNEDIAWHAGNWWWNEHSIGIEHEGYMGESRWFTRAMIKSSARLTANLCRRYRIRPTRRNIVGHRRCSSTRCPGWSWPWKRYMRRVRYYYNRHR